MGETSFWGRARRAYWKRTGWSGNLILVLFSPILIFAVASDIQFRYLSPAEHLQSAYRLCGTSQLLLVSQCQAPGEALRHLTAIPTSAPEYSTSSTYAEAIRQQQRSENAKERADSFALYERNISGERHDPYRCANSTQNEPIVSFDSGAHWWKDDGRCQRSVQQKKDSDSEWHSYWSSTLRIDTDMDASWLPDEERACTSTPGENGRISLLTCSSVEAKATHNIPVEFWGATDRGIASEWKCRRVKDLLSDHFVCKALD